MGQTYPAKVIAEFRAKAEEMGYDPDRAAIELGERLRTDVTMPIDQVAAKLLTEMDKRRG